MIKHLFEDCFKCPIYFSEAEKYVINLKNNTAYITAAQLECFGIGKLIDLFMFSLYVREKKIG